jgi:hypothetical protein
VEAEGQILLQPSNSGAEMTGTFYSAQITDDDAKTVRIS